MAEEEGDRRRADRAGEASIGELSIALFALALIVFSPPLLVIFSAPVLPGGVPLLYAYLFSAWGLVIALLALLARRAAKAALFEREPPPQAPPGSASPGGAPSERPAEDGRGAGAHGAGS
jgi:hypothetical protein